MKFKKKNKAPLSHSNLTEHENLRSHYDPNGSWTGTPDGWDKDIEAPDEAKKNDCGAEADRDVYGDFMPTENGYVQSEDGKSELEDGLTSGGVEAGQDIVEYPLEGQVAPMDGESYEQNTRDMQDHKYPEHTADNGMAETEAGGDFYTRIQGENGEYEKKAMDKLAPAHDGVYDDQAPMDIEAGSDFYHEKLNAEVGKELYHYDIEAAKDMNEASDVAGGEDIYQNDIKFDPDKYESGEWKQSPEERPAPKRDVEIGKEISHDDVEIGSSVYPLGTVGMPVGEGGYPSVPDGELTMEQAGVKEDVVPVQDADDL